MTASRHLGPIPLPEPGHKQSGYFTFDDARAAFWYGNSMGLVEIAAPRSSAARKLHLRIGTPVTLR